MNEKPVSLPAEIAKPYRVRIEEPLEFEAFESQLRAYLGPTSRPQQHVGLAKAGYENVWDPTAEEFVVARHE